MAPSSPFLILAKQGEDERREGEGKGEEEKEREKELGEEEK